ncbi:hypothetical protein HYW36_00920 [Candidatus Saccharibacteria bacterium]|nr:hypothetical protein [Candidatus Saccharibacteria bacterium]
MVKYRLVDLHRKKSDVLIIHCSDPRFQDAHRHMIDKIDHYYDLLVMPGASKAVVDNSSVIEAIQLLYKLHHFNAIHIMDHIECGVFGAVENEIENHSKMLTLAAEKIKLELPQLEVVSHLLGEKAEIKLEI